jgi:Ca2+-binding EF-hand superfamily protein/CRP-like cAMP-binding protein
MMQSAHQPCHPLSFADVALRCQKPLSVVHNVFNIIVQCFGDRAAAQKRSVARSTAGEVSLVLEPLGRLECCRGVCQFLFNRQFCDAVRLQPTKQRPLQMRGDSAEPRADSRTGRLSRARDVVESVPPSRGARPQSRGEQVRPDQPRPGARPTDVKIAWDDEDREVATRNNRSPSPSNRENRNGVTDIYTVARGTGRASTVSLTDDTHSVSKLDSSNGFATKKMYATRAGASPIPEQSAESLEHAGSLYMNPEQVKAVRRMCRLLDVFKALDKSSTGFIKAHDISVGLARVLGIQITGPQSHALIDFMSKGSGERVSRCEFVRAFQYHERLSYQEAPLRMEAVSFEAGQAVVMEGDDGHNMFVLQSGTLVVEKSGKVVHSYTRPGEYFGGLFVAHRSALSPSGRRQATVRASEPTRCVKLHFQSFNDHGVPQLHKSKTRTQSDREPLIGRRSSYAENDVTNSRQTGKLGPKSQIDSHSMLCNIPLFEAMPHELTEEIAKKLQLKNVPKKRWVAREGDFGDGMFIVAEGIVDVIVPGVAESEETSLRLRDKSMGDLRVGECFGELSLFFRERRKTSVRSRIPSRVLKLSTHDFERLLKPHAALYLGILFMAQQQRLQELRGENGPPEIFGEIAESVCDDTLALNVKRHPERLKSADGVPVWQLRSLSHDVLVNWSSEDIDWLLAGGTTLSEAENAVDPATQLRFNNPKQLLDYNKLIIGVKEMVDIQKVSVADTWNEWHREWSDEHQRFYFSTSTPRGTSRQSQWKPPSKSPWAPKELESSSEEDATQKDFAAGESHHWVPHSEDLKRSTSPWIMEPESNLPKWLRDMQESIESKSTNVRVLFRNFDADNSGTIDYEELQAGLARIGFDLDDTEWLELLELVDPHNSGEIEINDLVSRLHSGHVKEEALPAADMKKHEHNVGKGWMRDTFTKLRAYIARSGMSWPQAFVYFRTGRSGHMSAEDFYNAIRKGDMSLSINQMDELMAVIDTNKDGVISLDEWLYRFEDKVRPPDWEDNRIAEIKEAMDKKRVSLSSLLKRLDTNADGKLSVTELARGFVGVDPKCTTSDAMDIARTTDTDSSGMVNMMVLTERLTGQQAAVADWEDKILKKCRNALLASNTSTSISELFAKFDFDGNGTLDEHEFRRGIQSLGVGISVGEIEKLREMIDEDGDGEISFHEFVTRFLNRQVVPVDEVNNIKRYLQLAVFDQGITWRKLFDRMDRNRSSLISVQELKDGLMAVPGLQKKTKMTETTIEGLFLLADGDEDGFLTYPEFCQFFAMGGRESIVMEETAPSESGSGYGTDAVTKAAAVQAFRDQIYKRGLSLLEAFRAFDVDGDGFVSRGEFCDGFLGKSRAVAITLGDLRSLKLSRDEIMSIYDAMPGANRDFVDFDGFRSAAEDEKPPAGWEQDVVKAVHRYMHKNAYTVDQVFKKWNYRLDGMLDIVQMTKGLSGVGVRRSSNLLKLFFQSMDHDQDGIVNVDNFRQRFNYSLTAWDWAENALQTIAEVLLTGYPDTQIAYRSFMERAAELSLRPMNWANFEHFFEDIDEVLELKLRAFEWKHLFHSIDLDDDGVIGEDDFVGTFRSFVTSGRVTPVSGNASVKLSSAEVFRRADSDATGFLDWEKFKIAIKLVRPQADATEMDTWWKHVDREKRGRVAMSEFCGRMASRPQQLDWEAITVEEIAQILETKRDALKRVFDLEGGHILSRAEFRESLVRLGLGISNRQADLIFDRVDVAKDGAVDVKEFIAFVNGASTTKPPSILNDVKALIQMHMGSAEVFYLWILKKCKLEPQTRAISDAQFATGLRALVSLCPDPPRAIDDKEMPDLFRRCGGRNRLVKMEKFLHFFASEAGPFEMKLPVLVERIAVQKIPFIGALIKRSQDGKTVPTTLFKAILAQGFLASDATEKDWENLTYIADPFRYG